MSVLLTILTWSIAFIVCAIVGLIIYATWNYGKLDGLGFPVIKPYLFFGSNYMEPYRVQMDLCVEREQKHGTIYGAYDGRAPAVYITDPKMVRLICKIDSDYFRDKAFKGESDPMGKEFLDILKGEKWKAVRSALTPIYTSTKIKKMSKICKDFGDEYAEYLKTNSMCGKIEKFNMKEFCPSLIIECLAKSYCGIEIPNAKDPNNVFIKSMKKALFDDAGDDNWIYNLLKMFPFILNFRLASDFGNMDFFKSVLKLSLESKLNSKTETTDAAYTLAEMLRKVWDGNEEYKSLGITETTIIAQGMQVFLASYLGVRDALVGLSYELSKNSVIQEKIYDEIINSYSEGDEESSKPIPFTTACVNEIFRLHVGFDKIERVCNRTWKYEGITIPKGMKVFCPMSPIHYNPKYFSEPMTFRPERFLDKENPIDPNLINTFGQGPRACIGSRFGNEIIKVLLISFVKKFKFVSRPDTEYVKSKGGAFTVPTKPVYVDLFLRI